MRYSYEFKRKCVEMYYQGKYPDTPCHDDYRLGRKRNQYFYKVLNLFS